MQVQAEAPMIIINKDLNLWSANLLKVEKSHQNLFWKSKNPAKIFADSGNQIMWRVVNVWVFTWKATYCQGDFFIGQETSVAEMLSMDPLYQIPTCCSSYCCCSSTFILCTLPLWKDIFWQWAITYCFFVAGKCSFQPRQSRQKMEIRKCRQNI